MADKEKKPPKEEKVTLEELVKRVKRLEERTGFHHVPVEDEDS